MKRSKNIRLLALGTVPLALAACSDNERWPIRTVTETRIYTSPNDCLSDSGFSSVCSRAYTLASKQHALVTPGYYRYEDCEADFDEYRCIPGDRDLFYPVMDGVAITLERDYEFAPPLRERMHAGESVKQELVTRRYFSEPLYRERVGRGVFRLTSLREQQGQGKTYTGVALNAFMNPQSMPPGSQLVVHLSPHALKPSQVRWEGGLGTRIKVRDTWGG